MVTATYNHRDIPAQVPVPPCPLCGDGPETAGNALSLPAAIDALPLPLALAHLDGSVHYANLAYAALLERPRAELLGQKLWTAIDTELEREKLRAFIDRIASSHPKPTPVTATLRNLGGDRVEVTIEWAYVHDLDGRLVGFTCMVTDQRATRRYVATLQRIGLILMEAGIATGLADPSTEPSGEHHFSALSNREQEVLELLARGYRVATIARDLFISPNTVRNHLKRIYQKLEVHSQEELMELLSGRLRRQ